MYTKILISSVLALTLSTGSASALSFSFGSEGDTSPFSKMVSSLFATGKTGAALVGEISDIATTSFKLTTKQKEYTIVYSPETKVRKLGLPAKMSDVHEGDKVSVVSALTKSDPKNNNSKLRAKIVSILSQDGEGKYNKKDEEKKDEGKESENASSTEMRDGEKENASSSKEMILEKEKKEEKEGLRGEKGVEREFAPAQLRK